MLVPKFKDPALESEINENGFVVIPNFLPATELENILQLYKANHNEREIGCWNSLYDLPAGNGKALSEQITAIVNPYIQQAFTDAKFPIALFIVKNPGRGHESLVHRDDSMHDEDKMQYRQCWMPLVDLTEDNGVLYVVPKSHKLFTDERPMFAEWPYKNLASRLEQEFLPLYAKAGDLIVYFEKTLHGSVKNTTNEPRPVFQGGVMHKDASPYFTRYIPETNEVESYAVDENFFLDKEYMKPVIDSRYPLVKTVKYNPKPITLSDIDAFYGSKKLAEV